MKTLMENQIKMDETPPVIILLVHSFNKLELTHPKVSILLPSSNTSGISELRHPAWVLSNSTAHFRASNINLFTLSIGENYPLICSCHLVFVRGSEFVKKFERNLAEGSFSQNSQSNRAEMSSSSTEQIM